MFLFIYDCRIDPNGPLAEDGEFAGVGGAYVNIYINFVDYEGAHALSHFYIEREGWLIVDKDKMGEEDANGAYQIERKDVAESDEEFFNEAERDGYSAIYNM